MLDPSNLQFTIKFVDPELDLEEQDEQAMRLLSELKEMDEVEDAGHVIDPNPPEGNKSSGGFVPGAVQGEAEVDDFNSVAAFIGDRAAAKNIEMELQRNGRTLKIAASSKDDMQAILPLLQQFLSESEQPAQPVDTPRTILLLAAQPEETTRTRLDEEVRDIREGLARSRHRDQLLLETQWAVDPRAMQRALLDTRPSIVHFSGQSGDEKSQNLTVLNGEALAALFELFAEQVNCVLLNGCHSADEAEAIAQHIDYAIGMNDDIDERAAIEFAVGFYDALGAGESIEFAFNLGRNAIRLARLTGYDVPVLKRKASVALS